jgi:hypothetical protein
MDFQTQQLAKQFDRQLDQKAVDAADLGQVKATIVMAIAMKLGEHEVPASVAINTGSAVVEGCHLAIEKSVADLTKGGRASVGVIAHLMQHQADDLVASVEAEFLALKSSVFRKHEEAQKGITRAHRVN